MNNKFNITENKALILDLKNLLKNFFHVLDISKKEVKQLTKKINYCEKIGKQLRI